MHEHCCLHYSNRYNYIRIFLTFFDKTGTRERLFTDALKQAKADRYAQSVLEFAITPAFFPLLIQAYQKQIIDSDQLNLICRSTKWDQPEIFESLKQMIETKTDVRIIFPPTFDRDAIYRQHEQEAYDILFDTTGFHKACVDFLGERDSLSSEEYKTLRLNFRKTVHDPGDEFANRSVRRWMSSRTEVQPITLQRIEDWFAQPANMESFAMHCICDALMSKNPPKVSASQKEYLHRWFDQNIETVDFTQAIYISEGKLGWSRKTQWLVLLLNRFEFQLSDAILLDLTHCCFQDPNWQERLPITLEYIEEHLTDKKLLSERIITNIKERTVHINLLYECHAKYIFDHHLTEAYEPIALDLIRSTFDNSRWIDNMIEQLFNANAYEFLTSRWAQMNLNLKLAVARQLSKAGDHAFISEHLPQLYERCTSMTDQQTVYTLLIAASDIRGLEFSIQWAKRYKHSPFSQHGCHPAYFETLDALPHLMTLLELSYAPEIEPEHELDRMLPLVMSGLQRLALAKRDNYESVKAAILRFMTENPNLPEIRFLNSYLEQMKQKFGVKYAPVYTLSEARQLLFQQKFL